MKLYDEIIKEWSSLTKDCSIKKLDINSDSLWPDAGSHQMILRSDMAYELGGSTPSFHAIGATAVTEDATLINSDEILLIGPDLNKIKSDISYARLTLALISNSDRTGNTLYNAIKKIDNVRYHVNPSGFMPRVSSVYGRESIRVSKEAISDGLNFQKVGSLMLNKYHENSDIKAVKIIFITDPAYDFASLEKAASQAVSITQAIDHIMKGAMTDCGSCSLQKICDEVEGLREMHFGQK